LDCIEDILKRPEFRFFLDEDLVISACKVNDAGAAVRLSESPHDQGLSLELQLGTSEGRATLDLDDRAVRGFVRGMSDLRNRGEFISILSCMDLGHVSASGATEPFQVTVSSRNGEIRDETFELTRFLNQLDEGSTPFSGDRIKSGVEYALRVGRSIRSGDFDAGRMADTLGQLLMLYYFIRQRSL
jgi:hypothetical protein